MNINNLVARHVELSKQIKELEAEKKQIAEHIRAYYGDTVGSYETLEGTVSVRTRTTFDANKALTLIQNDPDIPEDIYYDVVVPTVDRKKVQELLPDIAQLASKESDYFVAIRTQ